MPRSGKTYIKHTSTKNKPHSGDTIDGLVDWLISLIVVQVLFLSESHVVAISL